MDSDENYVIKIKQFLKWSKEDEKKMVKNPANTLKITQYQRDLLDGFVKRNMVALKYENDETKKKGLYDELAGNLNLIGPQKEVHIWKRVCIACIYSCVQN